MVKLMEKMDDSISGAVRAGLLAGPGRCAAPAWWTDRQQEAWTRFQSLPMPKRKDEDWRFANINAIDLSRYTAGAALSTSQKESILARSQNSLEAAATAVLANDQVLAQSPLPVDWVQKGVIFEPIAQALEKHPQLLQKHFMEKPVVLGSEKFSTLHRAFCRNGMLLYVPKNVQLVAPLSVWHWIAGADTAAFPHTLIIADENSQVTCFDWYQSLTEEPGFACSICDLILSAGAQVHYFAGQNWNEQTLAFQMSSTSVQRDASAKSLNFNLGGSFARVESHSRLAGTGARSEMLGLTIAHAGQEFDQRTLQDHQSPHTWSDLLYKNTLNHSSKTIFQGLIKVEPGASQTDAYQTNRNLLLSPVAEADSMPGLEIRNDDVKCSHGSTTGQVNTEELFYMLARGIPQHVANYLISVGFTEEVLQRFGQEKLSAVLRSLIAEKFSRSQKIALQTVSEDEIEETNVRSLQGTE